ncbi:MAG: class IIc cyclic bacteriocin [Romboutsia sp.]
MVNLVQKNLNLSKLEKITILSAITIFMFAIASINIYFIAQKLGLKPPAMSSVIDSLSAGGAISDVVATLLGVTLPAWGAAAISALGAVSA